MLSGVSQCKMRVACRKWCVVMCRIIDNKCEYTPFISSFKI